MSTANENPVSVDSRGEKFDLKQTLQRIQSDLVEQGEMLDRTSREIGDVLRTFEETSAAEVDESIPLTAPSSSAPIELASQILANGTPTETSPFSPPVVEEVVPETPAPFFAEDKAVPDLAPPAQPSGMFSKLFGGSEPKPAEVSEPTLTTLDTPVQAQPAVEPEPVSVPLETSQIPEEVWSQIVQGQEIKSQVDRIVSTMPGDPTKNYNALMLGIFERFQQNFEATARAVVESPDTYRDYVDTARAQLAAIEAIKQNPADPADPQGHKTLLTAMSFWRQIPSPSA